MSALIVPAIGTVARIALTVGFAMYVMRQCRKPTSILGRLLARQMNATHRSLTQWGLSHVEIGPQDAILDVGCGGGRTIETLASATSALVCGIDYSSASVAVARSRNSAAIAAGHVRVEEASVSTLPFANASFDLATAVETHYYWPNLSADVREVMRVLKPGGAFLILAETYRGRTNDWLYRPVMELALGATYLTPKQHRELLDSAGYRDIEVFEERSRGWICVTGRV
jgi:ubiquinone/menaquinone biosynthesis C-methylase UbiE